MHTLIPGPAIIGLYGLFEDDFRDEVVGSAPLPPRPHGLLLLGRKVKKAWKPRVLGVVGALAPHGARRGGGPRRHRGWGAPGWGSPQPVYIEAPRRDDDLQQMLRDFALLQMLKELESAQAIKHRA